MNYGAVFLAIAFTLGGCSKAPPTVVLDGWWNTDYARSACDSASAWYKQNVALINQVGCGSVTSCKEMMPRVDACRFDGTGGAGDFETALATEFAGNPSCSGVSVTRFAGPGKVSKAAYAASQRDHWSLQLDFVPGSKVQSWDLVRLGAKGAVLHGNGTVKAIVTKVCAIASNVGAAVNN